MSNCYDDEDDGDIFEIDLTRSTYPGTLLDGLRCLRDEECFCDFGLSADNIHLRVHRIVLASVSNYFRALFRSGMLETQSSDMELKGMSGVGLTGVVTFIYSGKLRLNERNVMDIFRSANILQIEPVIQACTQYFIRNLNLGNIKDMQSIVDVYNLGPLQDAIHCLLVRKFTTFSRTEYFKQLPLPDICKLLKENTLSCSSEFKLMKIVFEWIRYNPRTRETLIGNLVKHIRLVFMSNEELDYLKQVPFVKSDRNCLKMIDKACYFKHHPQEQPLLVTEGYTTRSEWNIIAFGCNSQRSKVTYVLHKGVWCKMDKILDQPRPFVNAGVATHENFLYICGGEGIKEATSSCLSFNPYTYKWGTLSQMNQPRKNFALIAHEKNIYAICGITKNFEVTDSVEVFSLERNSWEYIAPYCKKVADLAACSHDRKIYVAGGVDENCYHVRDFNIFEPSSGTWEVGPNIPEIKFKPAIFSIQQTLYLLDLYRTEGISAQIDQYNLKIKQWTSIPLSGVQFSRCYSAVNIDEWIYFIGRNNVEEGSSKKYNVTSRVSEDIKCFPWEVDAPVSLAIKLPHKFVKRAIENPT